MKRKQRQMNTEKISLHNNNYKHNHVDPLMDTENDQDIVLMDFQKKIVQDMVQYDTSFFSLSIKNLLTQKSDTIDNFVKPCEGLLKVAIGLGKTYIVCERIRLYLEKTIDAAIVAASDANTLCSLTIDDVPSSQYVCSRYGRVLYSVSETLNNNGSRVLVMVPSEIFNQWIEHFIYYFGNDYVNTNVLNVNQNYLDDTNSEFAEIVLPQILAKKIILVKQTHLQTISKWNSMTCLAVDIGIVFIDEVHLLSGTYIKIANASFVWNISATLEDIEQNTKDVVSYTVARLLPSSVTTPFRFTLPNVHTEYVLYYIPILFKTLIPGETDLHNTLLLSDTAADIITQRLKDLNTTKIVSELLDFFMEQNDCFEFEWTEDEPCQQMETTWDWKSRPFSVGRDEWLGRFRVASASLYEAPLLECCSAVSDFCDETFRISDESVSLNKALVHSLFVERARTNRITTSCLTARIKDTYFPLIENIQRKHNDTVKRLEQDWCLVCFQPDNKILLVCCNQVICRHCVIRVISYSPYCPHCRSPIGCTLESYLNRKCENENQTSIVDESVYVDYYTACSHTFEKCKDRFKKILVVCDSTGLSDKLFESLQNNFVHLKGSAAMIYKQINKFRKNKVNFIFLNSKVCNVGLNLQFIDCIVFLNTFKNETEKKQMIGRAHRFPRTSELVIIYMEPRETFA